MTFRKLKTTNVSCLLMQTTQIGIEQKQKQLSLKYQQTHFTIFKTKDKNKPCNFAMKLKSTRKLLKKSTQYKVFGINNRQRTILEPYNILNSWKQKYKKNVGYNDQSKALYIFHEILYIIYHTFIYPYLTFCNIL